MFTYTAGYVWTLIWYGVNGLIPSLPDQSYFLWESGNETKNSGTYPRKNNLIPDLSSFGNLGMRPTTIYQSHRGGLFTYEDGCPRTRARDDIIIIVVEQPPWRICCKSSQGCCWHWPCSTRVFTSVLALPQTRWDYHLWSYWCNSFASWQSYFLVLAPQFLLSLFLLITWHVRIQGSYI